MAIAIAVWQVAAWVALGYSGNFANRLASLSTRSSSRSKGWSGLCSRLTPSPVTSCSFDNCRPITGFTAVLAIWQLQRNSQATIVLCGSNDTSLPQPCVANRNSYAIALSSDVPIHFSYTSDIKSRPPRSKLISTQYGLVPLQRWLCDCEIDIEV